MAISRLLLRLYSSGATNSYHWILFAYHGYRQAYWRLLGSDADPARVLTDGHATAGRLKGTLRLKRPYLCEVWCAEISRGYAGIDYVYYATSVEVGARIVVGTAYNGIEGGRHYAEVNDVHGSVAIYVDLPSK